MESLYLLIPVSIFIFLLIIILLIWSSKNGQFDDLKGPGYRIIMDDDNQSLDNDNKSRNNRKKKVK